MGREQYQRAAEARGRERAILDFPSCTRVLTEKLEDATKKLAGGLPLSSDDRTSAQNLMGLVAQCFDVLLGEQEDPRHAQDCKLAQDLIDDLFEEFKGNDSLTVSERKHLEEEPQEYELCFKEKVVIEQVKKVKVKLPGIMVHHADMFSRLDELAQEIIFPDLAQKPTVLDEDLDSVETEWDEQG